MGNSAAAFVLRNQEGFPIVAGALCLGAATIIVVEATALQERLLLAKRKDTWRLMVKEDSLLVIQLACGEWKPH